MKNKVLFSFLVLFLFGITSTLFAQTALTASLNLLMNFDKPIVREHNYLNTVCYVEGKTNNLFLYIDSSLSVTNIPIDTAFKVNDFVVDADSVFFCGETGSGLGFIGFFDINDFFWGTHEYYVISAAIQTADGIVSSLEKLVAYNHFGIRHIVSYGNTTTSSISVIDFKCDFSIGAVTCETGIIPPSSPETIVDITTDDYVVYTSGMYYGDSLNPNLSFRLYTKNDVFSTIYPMQDNVNVFSDAANQMSFCLSQVVTRQVGCNEIVAAAYWKYNSNNMFLPNDQNPKGTFLGIFENAMDPKIIIKPDCAVLSYHNYYLGKWKLHGFSYRFTNDQTFNLLQDFEISPYGNPQSAVFELSDNILQFAWTIPCSRNGMYKYKSINGHFAGPIFELLGIDKVDPNKMIYSIGHQGYDVCTERDFVPTEPVTLDKTTYFEPFAVKPPVDVYFVQYFSQEINSVLEIECTE